MCWNAQVSLNTFLFGAFGVSLALLNGYSITQLLFIISFVLIQLVEFFTWTYYDNKKLNAIIGLCGLIVILLQPVGAICLLGFNKESVMLILLYCSLMLPVVIRFFNKPLSYFKSYVGANGHLVWNWATKKNIHWYAVAVYMGFLFAPMLITRNWMLLAFVLFTLIISVYVFTKYDTWGTMWCWMANIIVFVLVIRLLSGC